MQKLHYTFLICLGLIVFSLLGCSAANTNEIKSTSPTFHQRWIAPNPNATPVPGYVTAWPKQVSVEKPDPVLGDKLVWEHWIYGEEFAKRFEGFALEKVDKELQNSPIKAIVLRLFKKNLWEGINPNYPEQYTVDIDVYFDDAIKIPLSERLDTNSTLRKYPKSVEASFKKLIPMKQNDKKSLEEIIPTSFALNQGIYIFVTPIDGRFTALGRMYYYPTIVSGLSCITLRTGQTHGSVVPLQENGALWLSLFGDRSFDVHEYPTSVKGGSGLYKKTDKTFEPGEHPEEKGYVKLPRSFYEVALPKMTLIKVLNVCISDKQYLNKASKEAQEDLLKHCNEIEETGVIYDLYNNRYGLTNGGF